jgi:heme-degrading monooxygenase HmoA
LRRGAVFARVSIYEIPQEKRAEAQTNFSSAIASIRETAGITDAQFLFGCDSDRAVTITFWESHEAMAASRVVASRLRSEAAAAVEGDVLSVEEFEVVPVA